jgi:hypothetical protein
VAQKAAHGRPAQPSWTIWLRLGLDMIRIFHPISPALSRLGIDFPTQSKPASSRSLKRREVPVSDLSYTRFAHVRPHRVVLANGNQDPARTTDPPRRKSQTLTIRSSCENGRLPNIGGTND